MEYFIDVLVTGIMDAIEEFFDALTVPSRRYTLNAFFVSIAFLVWSVIAYIFELPTFVDWQEALVCSILLGIIVLIDSSTRSQIKSNLKGVKELASRFTYSETDEDEDEINIMEQTDEIIPDENILEQEVDINEFRE